ncbi:MAG: 2-oxoacid:acceptor oxidoreductase family protein [Filomicrobium sp.]
MFQVRLHGRGGQGVVTAAELLSIAGFTQGKHAQAFPSFGSERTGAPVVSFCRLDEKEIRLREPILEPDCVIVQDPTLFHAIDVFQGLKPGGYVLINSGKSIQELGVADQLKNVPEDHIRGVNATELAIRHVGRPVPNAALLGGFAAISGQITLEAVEKAIATKFGGRIAAGNIEAARAAHAAALSKETVDAETA